MRAIFFVNDRSEVGYRQTTALLIAAFIRANRQVVLASVDGLAMQVGSAVHGLVTGVVIPKNCISSVDVAEVSVGGHVECSTQIQPNDLVMIRTNPGRDQERVSLHQSLLHSLCILESLGVQVVNSPQNLELFASKASLAMFNPKHRPNMIVSQSEKEIADFVHQASDYCVIKPLIGSRGQNIVRIHRQDDNFATTISKYCDRGPCVVQHFVTTDIPGDQRVVVLDGQILTQNNFEAGIYRRPADNDFRGNLHAGGTAMPLELNESARIAVVHAAEVLQSHGVRLAGVDLVGNQIIETNVFSTGGLFDANRFAACDFTDQVVSRLTASLVGSKPL